MIARRSSTRAANGGLQRPAPLIFYLAKRRELGLPQKKTPESAKDDRPAQSLVSEVEFHDLAVTARGFGAGMRFIGAWEVTVTERIAPGPAIAAASR